jgi:hypothetical protein
VSVLSEGALEKAFRLILYVAGRRDLTFSETKISEGERNDGKRIARFTRCCASLLTSPSAKTPA